MSVSFDNFRNVHPVLKEDSSSSSDSDEWNEDSGKMTTIGSFGYINIQLEIEAKRTQTKGIHLCCLCSLDLDIKLNFNILKEAYWVTVLERLAVLPVK